MLVGRRSTCSLCGQEGAVLRLVGRDEASDGRRAGLAGAPLSAGVNLGEIAYTLASGLTASAGLNARQLLLAQLVGVTQQLVSAAHGQHHGIPVVHDVKTTLTAPYWLDEAWVALSVRFPLGDLPVTTSSWISHRSAVCASTITIR